MHKILYAILFSVSSIAAIGQTITTAQRTFLNQNNVLISTDTNLHNANWKAIANQVKNKQIILLGEFNQSSREIFQTRNSLIKYLHKTLGINVILFESGIGELASTDMEKETLSPGEMTNGLVGSWRTQEFRELMAYIKAEDMSVAGFDVQRTGGSFSRLLKENARNNGIDSIYFYNLEIRFGNARQELSNSKSIYDSVSQRTYELISDYKKMSDRLTSLKDSQVSPQLKFCVVTIENRIKFLSYMLAFLKDWDLNKRWAARDSAMAENIEWLRNNIYRNQPVIVIAHNFHISRLNEQERVMGEILAARHSENMYVLGVFAGSGIFQDNFGRPKKMTAPDSTAFDIKHVIQGLRGSINFINIPKRSVRGGEWLWNPITINDTFIDLDGSNKMILAKCFDGLLLVDTVTPPKK